MKKQERKISFLDADKKRHSIEMMITHRNGYPEFTMCGDSGQKRDINPDNKYQKELLDIWNKWHLNGMHAGTVEQEEALESKEFKEFKKTNQFLHQDDDFDCKVLYLKVVGMYKVKYPNKEGFYTYGSGRLRVELPINFWADLMGVCDHIIDFEVNKRSGMKVVDPWHKDTDEGTRGVILGALNYEMDEEEISDLDMRKISLAMFLGLTVEELRDDVEKVEHGYGEDVCFTVHGSDYYCGENDAIVKAVKENIQQTVWAFNAEFLEDYMPEGVNADTIKILQEKCEGANDAILEMVGDNLDDLVDDAISADTIGHFLNNYDYSFSEMIWENNHYYFCRT